MASRLKRYNGPLTIRKCASEIIHKKANIVLQDGRVHLGIIEALTETELTYTNTRNSTNKLALNTIFEIIIDSKA